MKQIRRPTRAAFRRWLESKPPDESLRDHADEDSCACSGCIIEQFFKEVGYSGPDPAWALRWFFLGSPEFPDSAGDDLSPRECLALLDSLPARVRPTKREREAVS